ncbi:MAG: hypothetical protein H8E98_04595 [Bacteroidetes bacterium]|nr:hypothetical protein [Bacteroidota bacterium]
MKKSLTLALVLLTTGSCFANNGNETAFQIGQILGVLFIIGVPILIIWLIVRAIKRKKRARKD